MKRREQREQIFALLFRVEFNTPEEMDEQVSMYVDEMKEVEPLSEKDEEYIIGKYKKILERIEEIDGILRGHPKQENIQNEQSGLNGSPPGCL